MRQRSATGDGGSPRTIRCGFAAVAGGALGSLALCLGCGAVDPVHVDAESVGSAAGGPGDTTTVPVPADAQPSEPVPIIVVLATEPGSPGSDDTKQRLMSGLRARLPREEFDAIREFGVLPAIALSAEPDLIAWLLTRPEVASIEPDREAVPLVVDTPPPAADSDSEHVEVPAAEATAGRILNGAASPK